jgi:heterodisulfide reductase subunit C
MPIHEKSLIRPENLKTVDVSGHWSTFIEARVVTDYNEALEEEIAALPGGEYIHRCWQCGSCTNSCTVNAINPDFNPRYWIYLIRVGMESELLRDKDIIWQCVSCNKCTYACPRDVFPEGVMKATSHWLELKGHTPKSPSMHFDEVFTEQIVKTGKIEESRTIRPTLLRADQTGPVPGLDDRDGKTHAARAADRDADTHGPLDFRRAAHQQLGGGVEGHAGIHRRAGTQTRRSAEPGGTRKAPGTGRCRLRNRCP